MITPTFQLPDVDRRTRWGWWLLLILLSLLIGGSTCMYLSQSKYDVLMKRYVFSDQSAEFFGQRPVERRDLEAALREVESSTMEPDTRALYATALRDLLNIEPRREDLARLATSRHDDFQTVSTIYSARDLKVEKALELAGALEDQPFALQVAKQQAYDKAGLDTSNENKPGQPNAAMGGLFVLLLLAVGVGSLIFYAVRRSQGHLPVAGFPLGFPTPAAADRYAARAGLVLLLWLTIEVAFIPVASNLDPMGYGILRSVLLVLLALFLVPNLPIAGRVLGASGLGLRKLQKVHAAWAGLAAPALWVFVVVLGIISLFAFRGLPPPEHPITVEMGESQSPWTIVAIFFMASICAPIWEEITFRGFLFPAFAGVFRSPIVGILLSSLCFAAIHPTGIPAWPMLAAIGAVCAILYYHTGSLWPAILLHCFHNTITLSLALFFLG